MERDDAAFSTVGPGGPVAIQADAVLDAGEEGCATLSGTLRRHIRALAPGQVLELRSTEPSAHTDVPAWCRLTGHALLAVEERGEVTVFFIRRKEE